ncbi:MAG: TRAP transporter small permease [Acidobacteria bacterium]|nr:TRAP transporter small permease [Acidobacteriota bacterium]MYG76510.1 TRAP transporter small permease [Acidobacteriota bacterium]
MNGFTDRLWRTLETGAALALGLMAALVIYQVGARYLFGSPPSWTEELARFLQVWLVLLASPICVRRGMHLAVDYVTPRLPPAAALALRTGVLLISAFFCLGLAFYGARLLAVAGFQTSPALGISMIWPYLAVPVSGVLMALAAGVLIVSGLRRGTAQEDDEP